MESNRMIVPGNRMTSNARTKKGAMLLAALAFSTNVQDARAELDQNTALVVGAGILAVAACTAAYITKDAEKKDENKDGNATTPQTNAASATDVKSSILTEEQIRQNIAASHAATLSAQTAHEKALKDHDKRLETMYTHDQINEIKKSLLARVDGLGCNGKRDALKGKIADLDAKIAQYNGKSMNVKMIVDRKVLEQERAHAVFAHNAFLDICAQADKARNIALGWSGDKDGYKVAQEQYNLCFYDGPQGIYRQLNAITVTLNEANEPIISRVGEYNAQAASEVYKHEANEVIANAETPVEKRKALFRVDNSDGTAPTDFKSLADATDIGKAFYGVNAAEIGPGGKYNTVPLLSLDGWKERINDFIRNNVIGQPVGQDEARVVILENVFESLGGCGVLNWYRAGKGNILTGPTTNESKLFFRQLAKILGAPPEINVVEEENFRNLLGLKSVMGEYGSDETNNSEAINNLAVALHKACAKDGAIDEAVVDHKEARNNVDKFLKKCEDRVTNASLKANLHTKFTADNALNSLYQFHDDALKNMALQPALHDGSTTFGFACGFIDITIELKRFEKELDDFRHKLVKAMLALAKSDIGTSPLSFEYLDTTGEDEEPKTVIYDTTVAEFACEQIVFLSPDGNPIVFGSRGRDAKLLQFGKEDTGLAVTKSINAVEALTHASWEKKRVVRAKDLQEMFGHMKQFLSDPNTTACTLEQLGFIVRSFHSLLGDKEEIGALNTTMNELQGRFENARKQLDRFTESGRREPLECVYYRTQKVGHSIANKSPDSASYGLMLNGMEDVLVRFVQSLQASI